MPKAWPKAWPGALIVIGFVIYLYLSGRYGKVQDTYGRGIPGETEEELFHAITLAAQESELSEERPPLTDLTQTFDVILQGVTKEFIAGYHIDNTFLMWLDAQYGDETLIELAYHVVDNEMDTEVWHELTGNSIHVLWLRFCQDSGYQMDWLDNVHWQETADEDEAVFAFTGDFSLADGWYTAEYMKNQPNGLYDCFSEELLEEMRGSDVLIMNNEFPYSVKGKSEPIAGKEYTFRADPEAVELLEVFGTDAVSLANNHVYDYGKIGLLDTLNSLNEAGMPYVGAGENISEASRALYYVVNGKKVAIVSATQIERSSSFTREATKTEPGVLKTLNPERFLGIIEREKAYSDYVIVLVHWGTEGNLFSEESQRQLAAQYVEAGADAVIGSHPHRLQGIGYMEGVPVAYSLGNFWFSTGTLYTTVAQIIIKADGTLQLKFLPCVQREMVTSLLTDEEEQADFYEYLASISMSVGVDAQGNIYDQTSENYPASLVLYDSDTSTTDIRGVSDNEGNAIDIVGNRR